MDANQKFPIVNYINAVDPHLSLRFVKIFEDS
jgi:hypothetical protein